MLIHHRHLKFTMLKLSFMVVKKSGSGNRLPPMVTAMVMTNKGMAVFSDEIKPKIVLAAMVSWWLMTFGPGVVISGVVPLACPGLDSFQVGHDVH